MNKTELLNAIQKSRGVEQPDEAVEGLLEKLVHLENTGKYGKMMRSISSSNDKSNFLAAVFEATFAFQFESTGLPLEYEVKQDVNDNSTIDFLRRMESGKSIYLEARLLQQDNATDQSIKNQLESNNFYQIVKNGEDDHDSIIRLQSVILSKIQKKDGTPTKFLRVDKDIVNIVVIEVSDLILGAIDLQDCLLSTYGDPSVEEPCRRGIFGLFQEPLAGYPQEIQEIARSYEHILCTLNGVLFLFKSRNSEFLDYDLEHYLLWNHNLANQTLAEEVFSEIKRAIPIRQR